MKKEDVITLPNPRLREKSDRVSEVNDEVRSLISELTSAALDWEDSRPHEISAAIAAVQIDRPTRVIIVRSDFEDKERREFTPLINPEIVKYEGEILEDYEGCLSVSDIYGKVPRHSRVRIRATNIDGQEVRFKADGFLARVLQHEIDHTNGIVFIDHIANERDAFYELDEKGELRALDYDERINNNPELWD